VADLAAYVAGFRERGYRREDAALFAAAWDKLEAILLRQLEAAYSPYEGWRDGFRAATAEAARLVDEYPREARFMTVDSLESGDQGRRRQRALSLRLIDLVDRARAELEEPERVPPATAPWVVAIFFDRIYRHLTNESGDRLAIQLPELRFLAVSAFFGTEAGLIELSSEA
jgi:hypothetical protein